MRAANVGLERRSGIGAGGEVEILAVPVEDRIARVAQAVGQLRALAVGERVHEDRAQVVLEPLGVGQPLAVGRPDRHALGRRVQIAILVDLRRASAASMSTYQVLRCASRYAIFLLSGDQRGAR